MPAPPIGFWIWSQFTVTLEQKLSQSTLVEVENLWQMVIVIWFQSFWSHWFTKIIDFDSACFEGKCRQVSAYRVSAAPAPLSSGDLFSIARNTTRDVLSDIWRVNYSAATIQQWIIHRAFLRKLMTLWLFYDIVLRSLISSKHTPRTSSAFLLWLFLFLIHLSAK